MAKAKAVKPKVPDRLKVVWVHPSKISRYSNNPRINEAAVAKVKDSIDAFGWRQPIVVDPAGVIVVGDTRYLAGLRRGDMKIPVHYATDFTEAQAKAYRLADNRVHEEAEWDDPKLLIELDALEQMGADLRTTGFDERELARLMKQVTEDDDASEGTAATLGAFEYQVIVSCEKEQDQAALCTELEKRGLKCRLLTL